ncbi:MAG TPA: hypothetical protein VFW85_04035 [Gaiellaceae bacterium]|nr:hypothetical protein [Gaiellaceae bacterium]
MRLGGVAALVSIAGPSLLLPASLHVTLTPRTAGAATVRVQLTVHTELQCGRPAPGKITVTLPASERLPARPAVRLNNAPVKARVVKHRVSFVVPPPSGVICDVIGPGSFTVTIAHLHNPSRAGAYRFSLVYGGRTLATTARVVPS